MKVSKRRCFSQCVLHIIIHLVPPPVIRTETVKIHILFALAECKTILGLYLFTDLLVLEIPIPIRYQFAVVIDAIEDKMHVWMLGVVMSDQKELGIINTHSFHISFTQLDHQFICQSWCIIRMERDADMPNWTFDLRTKHCLHLEAGSRRQRVGSHDPFTVDNLRSTVFKDIVSGPGEGFPGKNLCRHSLLLIACTTSLICPMTSSTASSTDLTPKMFA